MCHLNAFPSGHSETTQKRNPLIDIIFDVKIALLIAISIICGAQEPSEKPERPLRIGPGVTPPRVVLKVEPEYPNEARATRYEGTVVLFIVVDQNGEPRDLKVIRPLGFGLDEKAIEAV